MPNANLITGEALYRVQHVLYVHSKLFQVTLSRLAYESNTEILPPSTIVLDYSDATKTPTIGASVRVKASHA